MSRLVKALLDFYLSNEPITRERMPYYNKCKNCGSHKLIGHRCNSCFYTDPDEPTGNLNDHADTCMCIECIPSPKDTDPYAADTSTPVTGQADLSEWDDLGGEVG